MLMDDSLDGNLFAPIQQNSLADVVGIRLRQAIISGELAPGARLVEGSLANQLGVSRSPVREALIALSRDGLVMIEPNRGSYVWEPTEADVDEIFSLRIMIESLAAQRVITRLTSEDLDNLEAMVREHGEMEERRDYLNLIRADRRFHEYPIRLCGHSRLYALWCQIASQWEVLANRRLRWDIGRTVPTVVEVHEEILAALRRRDLDGVVRLHRTHNERITDELKEVLRQQTTA